MNNQIGGRWRHIRIVARLELCQKGRPLRQLSKCLKPSTKCTNKASCTAELTKKTSWCRWHPLAETTTNWSILRMPGSSAAKLPQYSRQRRIERRDGLLQRSLIGPLMPQPSHNLQQVSIFGAWACWFSTCAWQRLHSSVKNLQIKQILTSHRSPTLKYTR